MSATIGTPLPPRAPTLANSAAGGGMVATIASGRRSSARRRRSPRAVNDHSTLGGNASGSIPARFHSGRITRPTWRITLTRMAARRASPTSTLSASRVGLCREVTTSTSQPRFGSVAIR
jgi:hypothetical protein